MELKFRKQGVVKVGTFDPSQSINLQDPIGTVVAFHIDMLAEKFIMTIEAEDDLNKVSRDFLIDLPIEAFQSFVANVFAAHIQPAARAQYEEFKDLEPV
jgi:hypothetical protein